MHITMLDINPDFALILNLWMSFNLSNHSHYLIQQMLKLDSLSADAAQRWPNFPVSINEHLWMHEYDTFYLNIQTYQMSD